MKSSAYLLLLFFFLLNSSCTDRINEDLKPIESNEYKIVKIVFFEKGHTIDSVIHQLDTISYTNFDSVQTVDTIIDLYSNFRDSIYINMNQNLENENVYIDSLILSDLVLSSENSNAKQFLLALKDPIFLKGNSSRFGVRPLNEVTSTENLEIKPCMRYDITGQYWRINYSVNFDLEVENNSTGLKSNQSGTLVYSRFGLSYTPGQNPHPQASQIFVSKIGNCVPKY